MNVLYHVLHTNDSPSSVMYLYKYMMRLTVQETSHWSGSLPRATGGGCVAWPFGLQSSIVDSAHSPGRRCTSSPRVALESSSGKHHCHPGRHECGDGPCVSKLTLNISGPHYHQIQGEPQHWSLDRFHQWFVAEIPHGGRDGHEAGPSSEIPWREASRSCCPAGPVAGHPISSSSSDGTLDRSCRVHHLLLGRPF